MATETQPVESDIQQRVDVRHGDFSELITSDFDGHVDLVFTDPPFNVGHPYVGYVDKVTREQHEKIVYDILTIGNRVLRPGGRLCLHVPDAMVWFATDWHGYLSRALSSHYELDPSEWITWHYRFGQHGNSRYINSKCHLITFIKRGGEPTWNPDAVLVQSDRALMGDKRTLSKSEGTPGMRVPLDVWGIPSDGQFWGRVQGNSVERVSKKNGAPHDAPNQLPEVYLARVIKGWTNPEDFVMDFCGGSGTTAVVAAALKRWCITCDVSEAACENIHWRLKKGAVRV